MQEAITILEKRQNSETKSDDPFYNYGKYIASQLKGMPEKDRMFNLKFRKLSIKLNFMALITRSKQPAPFSRQSTCNIFSS